MSLIIGVRENESFYVGDAKITVKRVENKGPHYFRIYIDAPKAIVVRRPDGPKKSSKDPSDSPYPDPEP